MITSASERYWVARVLFVLCAVSAALLPANAQPLSPVPFRVVRSLTHATDGSSVTHSQTLVHASNGLIYGTTGGGGAHGGGTLFRFAPDGSGFTVIRHFSLADGTGPTALLQGSDGKLYGTLNFRGSGSVIYSIALDGTGFTTLRTLNVLAEGTSPTGLSEGADGRLYVLLSTGAAFNAGSIARINRDGSGFVVLRSFAAASDGKDPQSSLVQASDGRFYGNTVVGGTFNAGTVFRINADGTGFLVLRHLNGNEGGRPYGKLVEVNGRLFGVASNGGTENRGTIFRLNLDGSDFTVVRQFVYLDGSNPLSGLVLARDGLLYGITPSGGQQGGGTIYRLNPTTSSFAIIWTFTQPLDGNASYAEPLLGRNATLYGLAAGGGVTSDGTIFSFALAPQLSSAATATAAVGTPYSYTIGTNVPASSYGASSVPAGLSFNSATGVLSGTPTQAGSFSVPLSASNVHGTTTGPLSLIIARGQAAVVLSNLTQAIDGSPKPITVNTTPAGLSVNITYNGSPTPPAAAGSYAVFATVTDPNYTGSATATLTLQVQPPSIAVQGASPVVIAGAPAAFTFAAAGSPPFNYQWQRRPAGSAAYADLPESAGFTGTTTGTLHAVSPTFAMDGDEYRLVITNAAGAITSPPLRLAVRPTNRLRNVSIRANIVPGDPLVVGVVTNAPGPQLLVRAIGPGLSPFVSSDTRLAGDPALTLNASPTVQLAANDNWGGSTTLAVAFASVGAFSLPSASLDAAVLITSPGSSTAQMRVAAAGIGIIEAYDITDDPAQRVVNLSALHGVGSGADTLVAGFVVSGLGTKTLLVRGIGPALRSFGVSDALADARIEVFDSAGVRIGANDDWPASLAPTFAEVAAFALASGSKDAALTLTVAPGAYTVHLATSDGARGRGLVEIYELRR